MIDIEVSTVLKNDRETVFSLIENIRQLSGIKKELKNFTIAREEPGLEIIDCSMRFLFLKINSRLKYTTRPGRMSELDQVKGNFKFYRCSYKLAGSGAGTELSISLQIRLPYLLLGYLISLMYKPIYKLRVKKEIKTIRKLLEK